MGCKENSILYYLTKQFLMSVMLAFIRVEITNV